MRGVRFMLSKAVWRDKADNSVIFNSLAISIEQSSLFYLLRKFLPPLSILSILAADFL